MAKHRMFTNSITNSDAFMEMPLSSQSLYFHLGMSADDDGFVNNPKTIQRMIGAADDDLKVLISKNFLIAFESGVVVLKHWKIHNYIPKDRYKPTTYQDEMQMLSIKENKAYHLEIPTVSRPCIQDVYEMDTQVKLSKDKLSKVKLSNCSSSNGRQEHLWDRLSSDEIAELERKFADADELIDTVDHEVWSRKRVVENPFAYIVAYAERHNWLTQFDKKVIEGEL